MPRPPNLGKAAGTNLGLETVGPDDEWPDCLSGCVHELDVQTQPIIALPTSTQRVASDGDTGYPVGHF